MMKNAAQKILDNAAASSEGAWQCAHKGCVSNASHKFDTLQSRLRHLQTHEPYFAICPACGRSIGREDSYSWSRHLKSRSNKTCHSYALKHKKQPKGKGGSVGQDVGHLSTYENLFCEKKRTFPFSVVLRNLIRERETKKQKSNS